MLQILGAECSKRRDEGRFLILREDKSETGLIVLFWGAMSGEGDEKAENNLRKKDEGKKSGKDCDLL